MTNEFDSPEEGTTLTLPRPRDRASQIEFLRQLSRSRRGSAEVGPIASFAPAPAEPSAPALAEPLETADVPWADDVPVAEDVPWTDAVSFANDVPWDDDVAFDTDAEPPSWAGQVDTPALSASSWFDAKQSEREDSEEPTIGLFDILPATTWPDLVAPEMELVPSPDIHGLFANDPWSVPDVPDADPESGHEFESRGELTDVAPDPESGHEFESRGELTDVAPDPESAHETVPEQREDPFAPLATPTALALQNRPPTITAASPVVVQCTGLVASRIARGKRHTILNGVDLAVRSGEVVVITGRSGSGKTTLLECLNGLHRIDAGTVILGEISVGDATDAEIAELRSASIGYVAQEPHLLADLSAIENIELPLLLSGWGPAEARIEADAAVSLVRLERPNYRTSELSCGERRRVAIARALVGEPSILWCDEMGAAVDPETMAEIYELIFELCHDGLSVVAVTHDPVLLANASTIYELRNGTLHSVQP